VTDHFLQWLGAAKAVNKPGVCAWEVLDLHSWNRAWVSKVSANVISVSCSSGFLQEIKPVGLRHMGYRMGGMPYFTHMYYVRD
jgi:hypothetical protein